VLIFYVTSRYRVPVVPVFIVFAAAALDRAAGAWRARDNARLSKLALFGALASLLVFFPIPQMNFSRSYNSLGIYFDQKGRYEESKRCYLKALSIDSSFADPYHNLALHYHFRAADEAKAQAYEQRAQAIKDYARAHGAQDSGL
jgi:tetratricopeptide (TPR) repeat protein